MRNGKNNSHERSNPEQEMSLKIRDLEGEGHCFSLTQKLLKKEGREQRFPGGYPGRNSENQDSEPIC